MTRGYLVELLSIEAFYGPGLTVEEAIKLEKHERFLEGMEAALISYADECAIQKLGNDERFNPDIMDQELINAGVYPSYDECGVRDDVLDAFGV